MVDSWNMLILMLSLVLGSGLRFFQGRVPSRTGIETFDSGEVFAILGGPGHLKVGSHIGSERDGVFCSIFTGFRPVLGFVLGVEKGP